MAPIPTPVVGQRFRLDRCIYEVRKVYDNGEVSLFPAFEARKSTKHMTWRALADQGELVTTAPRAQPRTGG